MDPLPAFRNDLRAPLPGVGLLLAALLLVGCSADGSGPSRFLSIGTGGTGGVYYPFGGALASRLSARDSTRRFTAEVTGGSVENVNRVLEGQIDLGFALGITVYEAYHEGRGVEGEASALRVVAPLYPNTVHVLVPRGSTAATLADLAGGRVSVGSAGSGTEQVARQLLEAHGLTYDDVEERFLTFTESAAALRDGALDAAILSVGYPAGAVLEATTAGDARLLPVPPEVAARLVESRPYYAPGRIPPGVYAGVEAPVPTVAMMNWVVALEGLDPAVVASLLNILAGERVSLMQVHPMAEQIDLSALRDAPIPLHPESRRFVDGG